MQFEHVYDVMITTSQLICYVFTNRIELAILRHKSMTLNSNHKQDAV